MNASYRVDFNTFATDSEYIELLRSRILSLEDEVEELSFEELSACDKPYVAAPPKGACVVLVNGRARASALSHSAAYQLMQAAKARGHRALYRPYH